MKYKLYTKKQKIKLFLANIINNLFPEKYCWAGLVMWALDYHSFKSFQETYEVTDCKEDMNKDGVCYCGKFRKI